MSVLQDDVKITQMCRMRALRCLFSLVDSATVERLVKQPVQQVKSVALSTLISRL